MKLLGRIWKALTGWLLTGVERPGDMDSFAVQVRATMNRELSDTREQAIAAIVRRNELRQRLRDQEKRAARLAARIRRAQRWGDDALAHKLLGAEMAEVESMISSLKEELREINEAVEEIRRLLRDRLGQAMERASQNSARHWDWFQPYSHDPLRRAWPDAPRVRADVSGTSGWSQRAGWLVFLLLLGVLGWRLWSGY